MNRTRMLVLASVALVLSAVVTFLTYQMLRNRLQPPEEMTTIVVAAQKVALGVRLTAADVRISPWPKAVKMEGSFSDPAQLVGRGVVVPMAAGEPILEAKLASKEAGAGLTTAIPEGMRAVAIKVNDVIGVAGFVVGGTRVDVILSGTLESQEVSKIILENVQVLTAGQNVDQDANGKPMNVSVITLLVTPEDAQKLALASGDGRIQLALRNPLDVDAKNPPLVARTALYSGSVLAAPRPEAPVSVVSSNAPARRRPAPRPVAVALPEPPPPPPPPPVKPEPKVFEVQLIQGSSTQVLKFTEKAEKP